MEMAAMPDWRSFWDSNHSTYVNTRHKDMHYREVVEGIASYVPGPDARVTWTQQPRRQMPA
jgi:hypothetical protein